MNNILYSKGKIVVILISGGLFLLTKWWKWSQKNFIDSISPKKPISVKELLKNKNKYIDKDVLVQGKIKSEDKEYTYENQDFYLYYELGKEKIFTKVFLDYLSFRMKNPQKGCLDKLNLFSEIMIDFLRTLINFFTKNTSNFNDLNWYPYLMNNDQVIVYGNYQNNYLNAFTVCQGNKNTLMEVLTKDMRVISNIQLISGGLLILMIGREIYYWISSKIFSLIEARYTKLSTKSNRELDENCSICKINYVNVVQLDCNHFSFCLKCFNKLDRKCPLCKMEISNFYVLQD